jgi:hypothetical protein
VFSFALRRLLVDAFGDAFDEWVSTKISAFSGSSAALVGFGVGAVLL